MIETLHPSPSGQDLLAATGFLASAGLALPVAGSNGWCRRESPELGQAHRRTGVSAMAQMIALVIMGQRKRTGLLADNPDAGVGQVSRGRPGKSRAETSACAGYVNKAAAIVQINPDCHERLPCFVFLGVACADTGGVLFVRGSVGIALALLIAEIQSPRDSVAGAGRSAQAGSAFLLSKKEVN